MITNVLRPSTMETLNLEVLNMSHVYTSFFYNFLLIVPNKHSVTPMDTL